MPSVTSSTLNELNQKAQQKYKDEGKLAQIAEDEQKKSALQLQVATATLNLSKLKESLLKIDMGKRQGEIEVQTIVGQKLSDRATTPATTAPAATSPAATAPVAPAAVLPASQPVVLPVSPPIAPLVAPPKDQPVAPSAVPTVPPVMPIVPPAAQPANSTEHVFKPLSAEHQPELQATNLNPVSTTQQFPRPRARLSVDYRNVVPTGKYQQDYENKYQDLYQSPVKQYDDQAGDNVQVDYLGDHAQNDGSFNYPSQPFEGHGRDHKSDGRYLSQRRVRGPFYRDAE